MQRKILIVDDRLEALWKCADLFREHGFRVSTCRQSRRALDMFKQDKPDVVLLDIKMPGKNGFELLKEIRSKDKHVCVIMLSAYGDAETVVSAMKLGADNFAEKSSDPEKVLIVVEKELKRKDMEMELLELKAERGIGEVGVDHIVGESQAIRSVKSKIGDYADSDLAVLITGESGVGKDLVAGALHYESSRRGKPFQHLFCPVIPETLFESEIFGHERGSFTDAHRSRKGAIEAAGDGTVFLNEIVEIPPYVQAKLLLVIETGVYMKVGGEGRTLKSDARFIAATNADIREALRARRLREDLFFRLNQASIEIPPLRERGDDILVLAEHFIKMASRELGKPPVKLSGKSMELLLNYRWPGNVRELEAIMKRVVMAGSEDVITQDASLVKGTPNGSSGNRPSRLKDAVSREIESIEEAMISEALHRFGGNRRKSAKWLDISYRSLLSKMKKYGLREQYRSVKEPSQK